MSPFPKIIPKRFVSFKISSTFAALLKRKCRAFSSAGSEHLPYKQRVGGSNPSTPTTKTIRFRFGNIHLPYKQRVGGSNPSTPTNRISRKV